ncbi:MAG: glycine cleavage system H protein [Patiriisocius sp.]|jgi:glycine cleavage system H protein
MNIPKELKYTEDHEWLSITDGVVTVGITDFAQGELGDIVFVEIDTEGESLEAAEVFGTIEAVKTVSDLFLPVEAKIIEVNEAIQDNPELINSDPYGEGWLVKIEVKDPAALDALMNHEAYQELVG